MAKQFRQICQETLGFLGASGFSDAQLSGDPPIHSITARFYGKTLAVECIWDNKEQALEVKIARLLDGKLPSAFAINADSGRRVRDHLTQVLLRRGVRSFGFRKVPANAALVDRWRSILEDYARLLQEHGKAVLEEAIDVLD
jgi:hypothetical protein